MRRLARLLLPVLLLTACQARQAPPTGAAGAGPGAALAAAPGAPAQAPAAAAPAGGGPGAAAAPGPEAAALRVAPALRVEVARSTKVYTGRGPFYLVVAELRAGTAVEYLDSREGWLLVRLADGSSGWLAAADALLTDARDQDVQYRIQPGLWELRTGAGPTVSITRKAAGVIDVALTGLSGDHRVAALNTDAVAVLAALPGAPRAGLAVGDGGVAAVSLSERGLLIDLESAPLYRLLSDNGDRVELELRPGLERAERTDAGWRFHLRGDVQPVLSREGDALLLDLPAAVVAPDLGPLPPDVQLETVAPDPSAAPAPSPGAATPARGMAAGGLRLHLPAPAQPYALCRPAPGQVELRLLTPGLAGKTIVIDPGHGGEESGAVGDGGHLEKEINLAVALRLRPLLEEAGAKVVMTRTSDERVLPPEQAAALPTESERTRQDLEERVRLANAAGADLLLSIHANGGGTADHGTETFWALPNLNAGLSQHLATLVQAEMVQALGLTDRGVKQRPFHVIRYTDAPAALVEMAFMTDPVEEALLASETGQTAAARALLRAVQQYFSAPA